MAKTQKTKDKLLVPDGTIEKSDHSDTPTSSPKPYDRNKKLKEILEQDKAQPYSDEFMGF